MDVENKVAVVTGGASGIGEGLVRVLVARGCRVTIADYDKEKAEALATELKGNTKAVQFDANDVESIDNMAEQVWNETGGVDLVFANAGVSYGQPLLQATPEAFDWQFGVNVRGVWATGKAFINRMLAAERRGHFTVTASEHSLGLQHVGAGFYTSTKHAVLGMADVLRNELPPETVSVSVFCPGLVATNLYDAGRFGVTPAAPEEAKAFGAAIMGKGMSPMEVAERAVKGVENDEFFIVTHPTAFAAAEKRYGEIKTAFASQAPMTAEAEKYEVNKVVASVLAELEEKKND